MIWHYNIVVKYYVFVSFRNFGYTFLNNFAVFGKMHLRDVADAVPYNISEYTFFGFGANSQKINTVLGIVITFKTGWFSNLHLCNNNLFFALDDFADNVSVDAVFLED